MKTRVAIYGLERLGRAVYAILSRRQDMEVVMVATDQTPEAVADALLSDAVYASLEERIEPSENGFHHEERHVHIRPVKTEGVWRGHDIDIVIDTVTTEPTKAVLARHQDAGTKQVLFAAPSEEFPLVILGSNEDKLGKAGDAITAGGPTEAAVTPVREILDAAFGVEYTLTTTTDGVVGCTSGGVCDCEDKCRCEGGCSCCMELSQDYVPVPALVASMTELICVVKHPAKVEKINTVLTDTSKKPYYQGIVAVSKDLLQSDTVIGESVSAILDLGRTTVDGKLLSLKIWYDREWGYANRLVELAADYGKVRAKK